MAAVGHNFKLNRSHEQLRNLFKLGDQGKSRIGTILTVCGWSRTVRKQGGGKFCFVTLSDGTTAESLQVIVDSCIPNYDNLLTCNVGCSFRFTGEITESPAKNQLIEMSVKNPELHSMTIYGTNDQSTYPLAKKEHSREYLREIGHLRPRTQLIGSVTRLRSALCMATHSFFYEEGFLYIHTPIITGSDCEGAGEMFQVTTALPSPEKALTDKFALTPENKINYSNDFFSKPTYLTVSGQLAVENFCCALSDVYSFGPTFRAENSKTSRHLAEFWMLEPEMAFADLNDNMNLGEKYLKFCIAWVLSKCHSDLEYLESKNEPGLIKRLENIVDEPFERITYTEAIDVLKKSGETFEVAVEWGIDLSTEHERYLSEKVYRKPVIVYNYPKTLKAFYMRVNDDNKTVAAMDILLPKIGEVIGGSQREERLDILDQQIKEKNLDPKPYWYYRDLRKYGTIPHSGFGLGFERLIMLASGIENIRDVIPFPRYPGHAEF